MRLIPTSVLLIILCPCFYPAQIDVAFISHLNTANLRREYRRYLDRLSASDSAFYQEAKFYLHYFNDSLFLYNYEQSALLCNNDTRLLQQASANFLLSANKILRTRWFIATENVPGTFSVAGLRSAYVAATDPRKISADVFPPELQASFTSYKKICRKKPLLAALMSCIIPGSGKLYAGRPQSSLMSFAISSAYGIQTYESAEKLGPTHPFTLVNAGAFILFYAAGIYGSYHGILDLRKERKKQFLTDAVRFYN